MAARYSDKDGATWNTTSLESGGKLGLDGFDSAAPERRGVLAGETSLVYHD